MYIHVMGIGMKWTIEFNQTIMDKIGFSIRKSTLFNVLLIQRLKKKIKIALGILVKKCVHLAPHSAEFQNYLKTRTDGLSHFV